MDCKGCNIGWQMHNRRFGNFNWTYKNLIYVWFVKVEYKLCKFDMWKQTAYRHLEPNFLHGSTHWRTSSSKLLPHGFLLPLIAFKQTEMSLLWSTQGKNTCIHFSFCTVPSKPGRTKMIMVSQHFHILAHNIGSDAVLSSRLCKLGFHLASWGFLSLSLPAPVPAFLLPS